MSIKKSMYLLMAALFLFAIGCDNGSETNNPDGDVEADVVVDGDSDDAVEQVEDEVVEEVDKTDPEPAEEEPEEESCDGCLIDGTCHDDAAVNPDNPCQICNVSVTADAWTDDDGAICDDDLWCTENDVCSAGVCAGTARDCDDGTFCNGVEVCDEDNDQCAAGEDPCDDGLYCNGVETCDEDTDQCGNGDNPCPADDMFCNGEEGCDEDTDQCVAGDLPCPDDGNFCNGTESCNELQEACEHSGDPCSDDGDFCNGSESCDEDNDQCVSSGDPCTDNGVFCDGTESCDEDNDQCVSSGDPCTDNGVFCDGTESCDEDNDQCVSSGDPCEINQHCDADDDICVSNCVVGQINYGDPLVDDDGDNVSEAAGDCNDSSNTAYPGAVEIFDGIDNDCNGIIDDGFDDDCDGFAKTAQGGDDCDDTTPYINPDAADNTQDTVDDNCDGVFGDLTSGDADNDGWAALGTDGTSIVDCDDNNGETYPGTAPNDDEFACMKDDDGDDWGDAQAADPIVAGTDCRDNDYWSWPGSMELPDDGIDQDCDGSDLVPSDVTGVFVSATAGDDDNPGTMAEPVATINRGHELAEPRNVPLFVASGAYHEDIDLKVSLFCGYEAFGWTRDWNTYKAIINGQGRDAVLVDESDMTLAIQGCVINGNMDRTEQYTRGIFVSRNAWSWVRIEHNEINGGDAVFNVGGVDIARGRARIAHNTITAGSASSYANGVYIGEYEYGRVWVFDNTIDGGETRRDTETQGAGVYAQGSHYNAWIEGNTINGGSSVLSAGVRVNGAYVTIKNNDINGGTRGRSMAIFRQVNNEDRTNITYAFHNFLNGGEGGDTYAMYMSHAGRILGVGNVMHGGSGSGWSYGAYINDGHLTLVNNTINGGDSTDRSYGIGIKDDYYGYNWASLINNIIESGGGNTSSCVFSNNRRLWLRNNLLQGHSGGGCLLDDGADCMNNVVTINQCNWQNCMLGYENINEDPNFVSANDHHISYSSECVDAGVDPSGVYDGEEIYTDIDRQSRPMGEGWDIGADEVLPPI